MWSLHPKVKAERQPPAHCWALVRMRTGTGIH